MRLSQNNYRGFLILAAVLLFCKISASDPPSAEFALWRNKYPKNALVSVVKKSDVVISIVGNEIEINQKKYREFMVLADNSSALADSKEYFSDHYTLNKFEAYSLVPEEKQYRKIPVPKYTRSSETEDYVFYDDQLVYNYTFPAVGKGTKLVTFSDATTRYSYMPLTFDFGNSIPNENMTMTLSFPKEVKIRYRLFGKDTSVVSCTKRIKGDRYIYTWHADYTRAIEVDNLGPDPGYVIPHLIIQVASYTAGKNETPVIASLKDLYGYKYGHLSTLSKEPSGAVKLLADSIVAGCRSDNEKVRNIFKWVQRHIKYIAIEDGDNGMVPSEAELVMQRRYGDCKGKTSLIVSMIRSQGLKASYAWVGSRERPYKYSEFPSVIIDDHMIAVWWDNDNPVILDGTTFSHRMEDIPAFIQGKECLIEKGKEDFMVYSIPVAPAVNNLVYDSIFFELRGDSIVGNGVISFLGESRANAMLAFEGKDTSDYKSIIKNLVTKASNKHMFTSASVSDLENTDQPFRVSYRFILPDFVTAANGNRYVSLNLDRFLSETIIKDDRQIPVEVEMPVEYRLICRFNLPEEYRPTRIPEGTAFNNALFGFDQKYKDCKEYLLLNSRVYLGFQLIDGAELQQFRNMLLQLNRNYLKSLTIEKNQKI